MKKFGVFTFWTIVCVALSHGDSTQRTTNICGDWTPYKEEKCLKVADRAGSQTQADSEVICKSYADDLNTESIPKLITIKTKEEQDFVQRILFVENEIVDNVWLGLIKNRNSQLFDWNDESRLSFNNWANESISDDEHECVQMESGDGTVATGLWLKVNCKRKNLVVCERRPSWTFETLQNAFLNFKLEQERNVKNLQLELANSVEEQKDLKQELANSVEEQKDLKQELANSLEDQKDLKQELANSVEEQKDLKQELANSVEEQKDLKQALANSVADQKDLKQGQKELKQELDNLENNPVPLGFIYAQLPGQDPPTILWPSTTWLDVSSHYSGIFFRVIGGNAAGFGEIQEGTSPRLHKVSYDNKYDATTITIPADGTCSRRVLTAGDTGSNFRSLSFCHSKDEVRPRNKSMKMWKRI